MSTYEDGFGPDGFISDESDPGYGEAEVAWNDARNAILFGQVSSLLISAGMTDVPDSKEIDGRTHSDYLWDQLSSGNLVSETTRSKLFIIGSIIYAVDIYKSKAEYTEYASQHKQNAQFEILESEVLTDIEKELAISVLQQLVPEGGFTLDDPFTLEFELGVFRKTERRQEIAKRAEPYVKEYLKGVDTGFSGHPDYPHIIECLEHILKYIVVDNVTEEDTITFEQVCLDDDLFYKYYESSRAFGLDFFRLSNKLGMNIRQSFQKVVSEHYELDT